MLEDLTAKGGAVMGRTLENYARPDVTKSNEGNDSDGEGDNGTPVHAQAEAEDQGSANAGRSTRGLRQAPPQRVLFQPDLTPAQKRKETPIRHASPSPSAAASAAVNQFAHSMNTVNTSLANFEPRQSYALPLKPVLTPANDPDYYRSKRQRVDERRPNTTPKHLKGVMLPGTGFIGPNIYVRAQLALQSGIPDEEQYALHHLVKISHERGDKYRFDQFPGLAEALINKLRQTTDLFYLSGRDEAERGERLPDDVDINISTQHKTNLVKRHMHDCYVHSTEFTDGLERVTEAGLVVRNMVMLDENAQYVAQISTLKDYICTVLTIDHPSITELQHYALETAEQVGVYLRVGATDRLYQALTSQLDGSDRGKVITSLRAISRLGMRLPENMRLDNIPKQTLHRVVDLLLLEDDELRAACLDFFFQFTTVTDNVATLIADDHCSSLVAQLVELLLSHAKEDVRRERSRKDAPGPEHATKVPRLANELIEQLLKYDEPDRSSHWLRMCFQDDPNSEVTQIDLWKSYQGTFAPYSATHTHLIAGDFIKNVSTTFKGASAQVAAGNKYVIRGIRPRSVPIDYKQRELISCQWLNAPKLDGHQADQLQSVFANATSLSCGLFFPTGVSLYEHILTHHMQLLRKSVSAESLARPEYSYRASLAKFVFADTPPLQCAWSTCRHVLPSEVPAQGQMRNMLVARHLQTHLPDALPPVEGTNKHNIAQQIKVPRRNSGSWAWHNTMQDERNDAAGVPLSACLVLRNLARSILRMMPDVPGDKDISLQSLPGDKSDALRAADKMRSKLMHALFDPTKQQLFFAMAHNYVLKDHLSNLLKLVAQGTKV